MTTAKTETGLIFDPWHDARPPGYVHPYPAAQAPATWHLLSVSHAA